MSTCSLYFSPLSFLSLISHLLSPIFHLSSLVYSLSSRLQSFVSIAFHFGRTPLLYLSFIIRHHARGSVVEVFCGERPAVYSLIHCPKQEMEFLFPELFPRPFAQGIQTPLDKILADLGTLKAYKKTQGTS